MNQSTDNLDRRDALGYDGGMPQSAVSSVLAIKTTAVHRRLGQFNGFYPKDLMAEKGDSLQTVWEDFFEQECEFVSEAEVAASREWKRVVPYFVLLHESDALTRPSKLTTRKHGTRPRTIGLAGHVGSNHGATPLQAYMVGTMDVIASRLSLKLEPDDINSGFIGFLNDDSSPPEAGYLCLAHLITINDNEHASIMAQERIPGARFVNIHAIKDTLEDYDLLSCHLIQMLCREEKPSVSDHPKCTT